MGTHLFEGALGNDQAVDHVSRYTEERGHTDAVPQDSGPRGVVVAEQPDLWREGQETDEDELHEEEEHTSATVCVCYTSYTNITSEVRTFLGCSESQRGVEG